MRGEITAERVFGEREILIEQPPLVEGGTIQRWSKSQQVDHRRCGC
jgi:hypothetical protein